MHHHSAFVKGFVKIAGLILAAVAAATFAACSQPLPTLTNRAPVLLSPGLTNSFATPPQFFGQNPSLFFQGPTNQLLPLPHFPKGTVFRSWNTNGLRPGVYQARPYTMTVVVPDAIDEKMSHPIGGPSSMPMRRPDLELVPRRPEPQK